MNKLTKFSLFVAAAFSYGAAIADNFTFAYRSTGEADLRPLQVFDDGTRTFLQMRGNVVPVVLTKVSGREVMLQLQRTGSYLVVPVIASELSIRYANLGAKVTYTGGARAKPVFAPDATTRIDLANVPESNQASIKLPAPLTPTHGATRPVVGEVFPAEFLERDTLIPFAKGKSDLSKESAAKLLKALVESGQIFQVKIIGRDDEYYVEGLARARAMAIRDRVLAAGVPLDRIVMKEGIARDGESKTISSDVSVIWKVTDFAINQPTRSNAPTAEKRVTPFEIRKGDMHISATLQRWAADAGYKVTWDAPTTNTALTTGDVVMTEVGFEDAVRRVVRDMRNKGYQLDVSFGPNREVRFFELAKQ